VAAHYLTLLVFQSQAMGSLISDPFGNGADLFGTAGAQIDYTVVGADLVWYLQVALVVVGHVTALAVAMTARSCSTTTPGWRFDRSTGCS
jgi:hypothetical protein